MRVGETDHFNNNTYFQEVLLRMPKFKLETKVQAKDMFISMNASRVFSDQAELDRITDDKPLGISSSEKLDVEIFLKNFRY